LFKHTAKACPLGIFEFLRSPGHFSLCQSQKETKMSCEAVYKEGKQLSLPTYDSTLHQLCHFAAGKTELCQWLISIQVSDVC